MTKKNLITACIIFSLLAIFWGWTGIMTYLRVEAFTGRVIMAAVCAVLSAVVPVIYLREYRKNPDK